jgi:hypothetical protein
MFIPDDFGLVKSDLASSGARHRTISLRPLGTNDKIDTAGSGRS